MFWQTKPDIIFRCTDVGLGPNIQNPKIESVLGATRGHEIEKAGRWGLRLPVFVWTARQKSQSAAIVREIHAILWPDRGEGCTRVLHFWTTAR